METRLCFFYPLHVMYNMGNCKPHILWANLRRQVIFWIVWEHHRRCSWGRSLYIRARWSRNVVFLLFNRVLNATRTAENKNGMQYKMDSAEHSKWNEKFIQIIVGFTKQWSFWYKIYSNANCSEDRAPFWHSKCITLNYMSTCFLNFRILDNMCLSFVEND